MYGTPTVTIRGRWCAHSDASGTPLQILDSGSRTLESPHVILRAHRTMSWRDLSARPDSIGEMHTTRSSMVPNIGSGSVELHVNPLHDA